MLVASRAFLIWGLPYSWFLEFAAFPAMSVSLSLSLSLSVSPLLSAIPTIPLVVDKAAICYSQSGYRLEKNVPAEVQLLKSKLCR